ncbi:MAG: hypothetical protein ACRDAJ_06930 [Serratia fonticola]
MPIKPFTPKKRNRNVGLLRRIDELSALNTTLQIMNARLSESDKVASAEVARVWSMHKDTVRQLNALDATIRQLRAESSKWQDRFDKLLCAVAPK